MAYLIGIDEAGYGPNLGPLVIGGTLWEISDSKWRDLFADLAPTIARPNERSPQTALCVGDSKAIYSPQRGIAPLESPVRALLGTAQVAGCHLSDLMLQLDSTLSSSQLHHPWYQTPTPLPIASDQNQTDALQHTLTNSLQTAEIRLVQLVTRIIEPHDFNQRCDLLGNKATVLTQASLSLVAELLQLCPPQEPAFIQCDRHGGRARYAEPLRTQWPDHFIEIRGESPQQSTYQWGPQNQRREIRFTTKAERFFEVAWASMLAKYIREAAMEAFNHFWIQHIATLQPTKGYPVDAKRFRHEIEPLAKQLGITPQDFWRNR